MDLPSQTESFPAKAQLSAAGRKVKWIRPNGSPFPGLERMKETFLSEVQRVALGEQGDVNSLAFRDPENFVAGELHNHLQEWHTILEGYKDCDLILQWMTGGVNVLDFARPFKGIFKGKKYESVLPPKAIFQNHPSCKQFSTFITTSISSRVETGAVKVWGKVGEVERPWLVLPLTVEPSKPRLCIDARFLNLWMSDTPFTLDKLAEVPRFIYPGSHMSKLDDKSGYDHIKLTEDSQVFFGFCWEGWWFVNTTLPFGWKNSPFVYQTTGMAATSYLRNLGVPCSLYIDDRLIGEILADRGVWSLPVHLRAEKFSKAAAEAALYLTCTVLIILGYTLGLNKSVLIPQTLLLYLGMCVDSKLQAFIIPEEKKHKFAEVRERLLSCDARIPLNMLQRFMGKCISFSLAFPGAKFYIREISAAIGLATRKGDSSLPALPPLVEEELKFWRFLDTWSKHILWRSEKHAALTVSTDASLNRWAAVIHFGAHELTFGDFWEEDLLPQSINVKEFWAVAKMLESLPPELSDCRLDVRVDNQSVIHSWQGRGPRSKEMLQIAKRIFNLVTARNLQMTMHYVPSASNPADWFTRQSHGSDAMLSPEFWSRVQQHFGGETGHTFDLMALDSNAMRDADGFPLPHFTPFPTPGSSGVNVFCQDLSRFDGISENAYVFPPFALIAPLLRFVQEQRAVVTIIVPTLSPLPSWWPMLKIMTSSMFVLAERGETKALLFSSRRGFVPREIAFGLRACRIGGRS